MPRARVRSPTCAKPAKPSPVMPRSRSTRSRCSTPSCAASSTVDDGDDLADRAEAEHAAVRMLIARFYDAPPPDLTALVGEILELVRAHVEFEEREILPELRDAPIDAGALERRLRAADGEAPSRSSGTVG